MKQTFILNYIPTDANNYINAERTNRFMAAEIKKRETNTAYRSFLNQFIEEFKKPVHIKFIWYVKKSKNGKLKDPDNIAFAKKFILDGLVDAGVIVNDTLKEIYSLKDEFIIDTDEQVIIDISEV